MNWLRIYHRLFRATVFVSISWFLYTVIVKLWAAFVNKPLSFTVDTNYLNWTTTFPSVSICEVYNTEKMWDLIEQNYGEGRNKYFDDIMTDVTFFSGLCYSCKKCLKNQEICAQFSLDNITRTFRTTCNNLLIDCKWNDEPFDCCEAFLELETEFGICFTINSMHTRPAFGKRLLSDRISGPGVLEVITLEDVELYLHSTEDIPSKNTDKNQHETILWGIKKEILFGVQEILNEEEVKKTSIQQRRCQFNWEVLNTTHQLYDHYSYSTCMVQCNFQIQLDTCGCVHHLMPKRKNQDQVRICGFEGLVCLTENYNLISSRRRKECNCMISCTEQEINVIHSSNDNSFHEYGTKLTISMMSLPKMRYIRKTVRSILDFIISLGGIVGLLYGASIITIVELLFRAYRMLSPN